MVNSRGSNEHLFLDSNRGSNTNSFIANVNIVAKDIDVVRGIGQNIGELDDKVSSVLAAAVEAAVSADKATNAALDAQETANNAIETITTVSSNAVNSIDTSTETFTEQGAQLVARAEEAARRAEKAADTADISQGVINLDGTWQITTPLVSGDFLRLPVSYLPSTNALRLSVNGLGCYKKDSSGRNIFQYEEVGDIGVLSRYVKILFDVPIDTVFNAFVITTENKDDVIAKCIFDMSVTPPVIVAQKNISAIEKIEDGEIQLFFESPVDSSNYIVTGEIANTETRYILGSVSLSSYAKTLSSFKDFAAYATATTAGAIASVERVSLIVTKCRL